MALAKSVEGRLASVSSAYFLWGVPRDTRESGEASGNRSLSGSAETICTFAGAPRSTPTGVRRALSQRLFDLAGKLIQSFLGGLLAGAKFLSEDGDFEFFQ